MVSKGTSGRKFLKKTRLNNTSVSQRFAGIAIVALVALAGVYTLLFSHAATPTTHISLSPASQTVTTGSNLVISVVVDTGGASVNTVQSLLSYNPANFSFVSITAGSAFTPPDGSFQGVFTNSEASGTIQFSAAPPVPSSGTVTPITGVQTVVTITLHATGTGTSAISLNSSLCGPGNFTSTCTAAYDATATGNPNDLIGVTTPIINGSYTVVPVLPSTPTGLSAAAASTTSIALNWTASTDTGGPGLAGYHIYRDGATAPIGSTTSTTFTDTGLAVGSSHTYTVAAYDTAANVSAKSSSVSGTTVATPTTPTALHSTSTTANAISIAWTASTDTGGPGLAGYHIYRDGGTTAIASTTGTTYSNTGLTASTSHSYTVAAYDTAGNVSTPTAAMSFSTKAQATAPTGLHSTAATTNSITLAWTAGGDTGGPGIAGYRVYRNGSSSPITSTVGTGTTFTDTGLTAGTTYTYTVATYDTDGLVSPLSASISQATTSTPGDLDADGHVTGHDLSIFLAHYGTNYAPAEFDGGTIVEGHDLSILLSNYGK